MMSSHGKYSVQEKDFRVVRPMLQMAAWEPFKKISLGNGHLMQ